MSRFFAQRLAVLARKKLAQYHPQIVAVTGSVGKTSTREAIAAALRSRFSVRTPYKNYNNELGVPLAILGAQSPGRDVWGWLKLFAAARRDVPPPYLVLEYGADRPGDIGYLKTIAGPDVAVITAISPVHVENYPSFEALVEEKASLGDKVRTVVLNADDHLVAMMAGRFVGARVLTYGYAEGADVRISDVRVEVRPDTTYEPGEEFARLRATLTLKSGEARELVLTNCVADTLVHACAAAVAVAQVYGVSLADALHGLADNVRPVAGRLRPLAGIKGSLVLDDTYNAAPASVAAGLRALRAFQPGERTDRRVAVLGDMAELGPMTEGEHRTVGRLAAEQADVLVAVGQKMNFAVEEAKNVGMPTDRIHWCADSEEAGVLVDRLLQAGDVVLVKGSQSMRMERVVEEIMAEPQRASELLVRQEEAWKA
jgi:UDP-N-acetylmuramoyl-tripeptide--D-alanyl-D-alanine ligase